MRLYNKWKIAGGEGGDLQGEKGLVDSSMSDSDIGGL